MLQRVGIAQALLNDPEVVFLDEPMSGLDPLGRRDVRALILELRDQGRTVFFSSHILATPRRSAAASPSSPAGGWPPSGRLSDMLAFQLRGWELVVAGVTPGDAGRDRPACRRGSRRFRPGRYTLELPLDQPPERLLPELSARRAPRSSRSTRCATRSRTSSSSASRRSARARRPRRRMHAIRVVAVNVFRESVRDHVLYNLVLFAHAPDRRLVSARPADGRAGRQDHQGPRPRRDVHLRAVHRHLHRHRAGVEGSRAAQHLRAARQAGHARRSSSSASTPASC